jgi:signal transduction histidine kinase
VERTRLGLDDRIRNARTSRRIGLRVAPLIAIQLGLAAIFAGVAGTHYAVGRPVIIAVFAGAFAFAGAFNMRLEFRRHQFSFTLAEAVLSASFFALGPIGIGIAAAVGEGVSLAAQRVSPLKTIYNVGNRLVSALVAAVVFQSFGHRGVEDATAWGVAIGAALCFSCLDTVFTAAVLATVERLRFHDVLSRSAPTAALTTLGASPLGVIALSLSRHSVLAPLLLVPLLAALVFNSRHAAAQRDEHLRFERLHEASSRTAHVVDLDDALNLLAAEANGLATGLGAICCTTDASGQWIGVAVDDAGSRRASSDVIEELLRTAAVGDDREVVLDPSTPALNAVIAGAASIVVARVSAEQAAPIAIAVLREGQPDIGAEARVQTLAAFANHASLTTANARLYAELGSALARQVDLNRQKGDFVAAVSHELRTPLAVMLAATHTLRKLAERIPEAKRLELLDASIEQGNRLQRLIDELLLVAAAEHEQVELTCVETEIGSLVADIEREMVPLTAGRLRVYVDRSIGRVVADAGRLRQILLNLVDNASKYAPEGPILLRVTSRGTDVRFALVDRGPGIPEADRVRVFEQFVQLDQSSTRRQGGTGLGLYLCRQSATLMGGTLTLDEVAGGGCCFTLTIPGAVVAFSGTDPGDPPATAVPAIQREVEVPEAQAPTPPRFAGVRTRPAEFARRPQSRAS